MISTSSPSMEQGTRVGLGERAAGPSLSPLPLLSLGCLNWTPSRRKHSPSLFDIGHPVLLTSGRAALVHALLMAGVKSGEEVLVPAYFCEAITHAIASIAARPVFYRIKADMGIDQESLSGKISDRTRAILVIHYFGFPQPLAEVRALCDQRGLALIEDCAHALLCGDETASVGRVGDFAFGSVMKFLPVLDGGCLVSQRRNIDSVCTRPAPATFQVKAIVDTFERAVVHGRLWLLAPLIWLLDGLKWALRQLRGGRSGKLVAAPAAAEGGIEFEPKWLEVRMSLWSQLMIRWVNFERIVRKRRANYGRLAQAFRGLSGCTVLIPELPSGVAPYVFPLLVPDGERVFWQLRAIGLPTFRWDTAAVAHCPVTARYARDLLQLPCYQDLSDAEIDRLIAGVRMVLEQRRVDAVAEVTR